MSMEKDNEPWIVGFSPQFSGGRNCGSSGKSDIFIQREPGREKSLVPSDRGAKPEIIRVTSDEVADPERTPLIIFGLKTSSTAAVVLPDSLSKRGGTERRFNVERWSYRTRKTKRHVFPPLKVDKRGGWFYNAPSIQFFFLSRDVTKYL